MINVLSFLLVFELIAISLLPLTSFFSFWRKENNYFFSRLFGLFLFSFISWALALSNQFYLLPINLFLLLGLVLVAGLILNKLVDRSFSTIKFFKALVNEELLPHIFYLLVFAIFLSFRYQHPEIYWGEKPMDFTFLNYFYNLEKFPVMEPWASGHQMKYYYGGFFVFANILKLPALYFSGLFLIFKALAVDKKYSIIFSFLICFCSNLAMLVSLVSERTIDSHTFWASTRVYTASAFTEYPFWSFVFADLHPHVMCLPFVCLFILFTLMDFSSYFRVKFIISILLGFILIVNSWDAISCSLYFVFCFLFYNWKFPIQVSKSLKDSATFFMLFVLSVLPFYLQIKSDSSANILVVRNDEMLSYISIFKTLGIWFLPLLIYSIYKIITKIITWNFEILRSKSIVLVYLLLLLAVFYKDTRSVLVVSLISIAMIFLSKTTDKRILILGYFSFTFFILTDFFVLIDRMNSVFKFHYFLWTSLSIFSLSYFYNQSKSFKNLFLFPSASLIASIAIVYLIFANGFHWNSPNAIKGINGLAYLENKKDYQLISWLRKNAKYNDVVLEAHGPSYQSYSRISANTGLQTVLGWSHHVSQRGVRRKEINQRENDIKTIYKTKDSNLACALIKKYGIKYSILSDLEFSRYKLKGNFTSKTESLKHKCLKEVFNFKNSKIYNTL